MPINKIRVLICSDAKNEADDQYAIVQALLTPKFDIVGMVAQFYHEIDATEKSYQEMIRLTKLVGQSHLFPIVRGATTALNSAQTNILSAGSELILQEMTRSDPRSLAIVCLGTLTDVALALRKFRGTAQNITIIWVGGGRYPEGSAEANLQRDLLAANLVMAAPVAVWQIPSNVYKTMLVSVAELKIKIAPYGELGRFLYQQLVDFANENNQKKSWLNSEAWVLGDSTAIGVLLAEQKGSYHEQIAPYFTVNNKYDLIVNRQQRPIRVYDRIDSRFILEDLFAKVQLFARR